MGDMNDCQPEGTKELMMFFCYIEPNLFGLFAVAIVLILIAIIMKQSR